MQALAASCEELRARTGNPPLRSFSNFGCNLQYNLQYITMHIVLNMNGNTNHWREKLGPCSSLLYILWLLYSKSPQLPILYSKLRLRILPRAILSILTVVIYCTFYGEELGIEYKSYHGEPCILRGLALNLNLTLLIFTMNLFFVKTQGSLSRENLCIFAVHTNK